MKFTEEQMKKIESVVFFDDNGKMGVTRVEGNVEGNVCGSVRGDVLGNVKGNVWGDVEYIRADIHEARVKELEAQVTWQPIETAPKDGTVIFIWYEPAIKHYSAFSNKIKKARWLNDLEEWSVEGVGGNIAPTVTHWMPLPNPSKDSET